MGASAPAPNDGLADSGRPVVEADHITKRYGSTLALDDVSLAVAPGSTHALVGRNGAGKSTLVAILTGLEAPLRGTVRFGGAAAPGLGDRDGWRREVACVYQKSTIIPTLTVAENLFLNRHARGGRPFINWAALRRDAQGLLDTWQVDVDVRQPAASLNVEQRQLVEIARALSFGARFIILDEPTAQLDAAAIDRLFERVRTLQHQHVTFLFISHHLQEIYQICDTVTVLRDARHILTAPVAELSTQDLVLAMTGSDVILSGATYRPAPPPGVPPVLQVSALAVTENGDEVSFAVRGGEVVGLAGGGGSGRVEVAESLVGLRKPARGRVSVGGNAVRGGSVPAALAAGIALVPQDRHREGFVPLLSIADNATLTVPHRLGRAGVISRRRRDVLARRLIETLAIKAPGPDLAVSALSGGNQQKVVMARALASEPRVLVLISPTAGIDVRSKQTLLAVVEKVRDDGASVLIASDDLDDLRACDRVLVMFRGRITREITRGWRESDLVAAMEGVDVDPV